MPLFTSKSVDEAKIVDALQKELASIGDDDQMPDFETAYSRLGATSNPSTNLNELEVQTIRAIILERQQQFDEAQFMALNLDLLSETPRIRKLRSHLLEKKDKIIESQNTHKRLISALWRLPTEILSLIFLFCLPDWIRMLPQPDKAPVLLTRVCRRWREVAVDMPNLWCKLSVIEDPHWPSYYCPDTWLKRTQGRPLSLELRCGSNNHWTESRKILQPYVHQVTTLFLDCPCPDASIPVLVDFSALKKLTIFPVPYHPIEDIAHSISQLPSTLHSLNILHFDFKLEFFSAFKPALWAHLTSVRILVDQPNTICHLLRLCPNLSTLMVGIYSASPQVSEPLTHTELQTLLIIGGELHNTDIFNTASFPGLRLLEACDVTSWPHEDFKAFLTRSNCSLERLIIGPGVRTTDEQRAEYVALIPSLELEVNHPHSSLYLTLFR